MVAALVSITIVAAIAIVLGILAQQTQTPPSFSTVACTSDEAFTLDLSTATHQFFEGSPPISIDPCHVYSETYLEARQKFRQAAAQAGAVLHSLAVAIPAEKSLDAVSGGDYTIDIAVLYGSGPGLTVHTSGVHGVEAYAGSPIQIAFLEHLYPALKDLPDLPTIVLIHAVNPFGMAHYRRTNENNVDLNRNGLHPDEWTNTIAASGSVTVEDEVSALLVGSPYEAYARLSPTFNPVGPPSWLYMFVTMWTTVGKALIQHGFDAVKMALVTGQYFKPEGVFYGGKELQPSLRVIWEFFSNTLLVEKDVGENNDSLQVGGEGSEEEQQQETEANSKDNRCCTGTVTWIDVHTGLGKSGDDAILSDWGSADHAAQQCPKWFPGSSLPQSSEGAKEVAKGYDNVKGFTTAFFRRLFDAHKDQQASYLAIAQEFGTVPGIMVAHALLIENRAFQHLPPSESVEWAKQTTKRAFYKQTPKWRRQILERGLTLLVQAVHRSSSADV